MALIFKKKFVSLSTHLAEFLSIAVRDESFEGLEAGIDALHAPALVTVGNLPPNAPFLIPCRLWGQGDVCQTKAHIGPQHYTTHQHSPQRLHSFTVADVNSEENCKSATEGPETAIA